MIVATNMTRMAKRMRSKPERKSSFARSRPPVIRGKPGITKSIEQM